jgi:hypothetical protein
MLKKIADNRDEESLAVQFRRRRFAFFHSLLSHLIRPVSILDVGGAESDWKTMGMDGDDQVFITLLNLTRENVILPNVSSTVGDALFHSNTQSVFPARAPLSFSIFSVFAGNGAGPAAAARETDEEKILGMTKSFVASGGWNSE